MDTGEGAPTRLRAMVSADEKRVSFRLTPSVRYYNSTHSATFDEELQERHPLYATLRERRTQQRFSKEAVEAVALGECEHGVEQAAEHALATMHTALSEVTQGIGANATQWKPRRRSRSASIANEVYERQSEKKDKGIIELAVCATVCCGAEALWHILETTQRDDLSASILACLDDRVDAAALVQSVERNVQDIKPHRRVSTVEAKQGVLLRRVKLPRSTQALKPSQTNDKRVTGTYIEVADATTATARVLVALPASPSADVVSTMGYSIASEAGSDPEVPSTQVSLYLSRHKKGLKAFSWLGDGKTQQLCLRLEAIVSQIQACVLRRRLGFQVLAYPDIVYGTSDLNDVQQGQPSCQLCRRDFNFLRRRQFCYVCASWVCAKCVIESAVERPVGWIQPVMSLCVACEERVKCCALDAIAVPTEPMVPIIVDDCHSLSMQTLATAWVGRVKASFPETNRHTILRRTMESVLQVLSADQSQASADLLDSLLQRSADDPDEPLDHALLELLVLAPRSASECPMSHDTTHRQYELLFDDATGIARSPVTMDERHRIRRVDAVLNVDVARRGFPALELLCELAAGELQCTAVFVSVVHEHRTFCLATSNKSIPAAFARDDGFCGYTLQSLHPLVVLDMARDVRSRRFTLTQLHRARFYCGVPLRSADDSFILATFTAVDTTPRPGITTSWYVKFTTLARAADALLRQDTAELKPRIALAA